MLTPTRSAPVNHYRPDLALAEIEHLVSRIARDVDADYLLDEDKDRRLGRFSDAEILQILRKLPAYLGAQISGQACSAQVQAFWEACDAIGAEELAQRGLLPRAGTPMILTPELACSFWMLVRHIGAWIAEVTA